MTFLELLILIAGIAPFLGAFTAGRNGGAVGIVVAIVIGAILAPACFFLMRTACRAGLRWTKDRDPAPQFLFGWAFVLGAFIWMATSTFTASWITKAVLRIIR